jgi:formate hydrogenlyase transcriptional activator
MTSALEVPPADRGTALRLLLEVSEAIATHAGLTSLFRDLARRLPPIVPFEVIALFLHDPDRHVMRVHMLGTADADRIPPGMEVGIDESYSGLVFTTQERLVIRNTEEATRFPVTRALLSEIGVESFCVLPLTTSVRRLGAIGFGSLSPHAFGDSDLEYLEQVARQVAVAVDNVLHHESDRATQLQLAHERDRLHLLLQVNNAVVSKLGLEDVFGAVSACLQAVIQHDGAALVLMDASTGRYRCHVLHSNGDRSTEEGISETGALSASCLDATLTGSATYGVRELEALAADSALARRLLDKGVKSFCSVPLLFQDCMLGRLNLGRSREDAFSPADVELLSLVAQQVAIAVENALAYQQIEDLKEKLNEEKLYLEEEIRTTYNFDEIVGDSAVLKEVLRQIEIVAPTDSTVLVQGETGTGKELMARAIHCASRRREHTFVKLNCAAIPTGLLESELFGHEKGAFTGAIAQKLGRFELAHGGTLFLDEVGDIPLDLQSKFLRVLQEQEFERVGGTRTIQVDVRLVAATNRNLEEMVANREFRSDLFYRLNVFPILSPALRERPEDIPRLVRHFTQKFARRMKKRISIISDETMAALSRYRWPGNIRELENFIERAVILSRGASLDAPLSELSGRHADPPTEEPSGPMTLEDAEREHIRHALQQANWLVGGPAGAAARLGMKRTTLQSKMVKLGIERPAAR